MSTRKPTQRQRGMLHLDVRVDRITPKSAFLRKLEKMQHPPKPKQETNVTQLRLPERHSQR